MGGDKVKMVVTETIIINHLLENRRTDLLEVMRGRSKCLLLDGYELMDVSDLVFTNLMIYPDIWLSKLNQFLKMSMERLYQEQEEKCGLEVRDGIHVRISYLPDVPEFRRLSVPKSEDVGNLISLGGTITKATEIRMLTAKKLVECAKCIHNFHILADYNQYYEFVMPSNCPSPDGCTGNIFKDKEQFTAEYCRDYQELKLQEQVSNLSLGTIPRSVWITVENDLVDSCKPGDDIIVVGCVKRRWRKLGKGRNDRTDIDLVIQANHIQVNNERKVTGLVGQEMEEEIKAFWDRFRGLEGRNKLLAMFCPKVFGLYLVKLAVAMTLAGGVERVDHSGTRVRGEPHLLLVGDPGTGKSQLLKYGSKMSQRSVMTTGIGSTSAGLTVAASREGGQWHLEAGALVLADGGVCCIDEFSSIREADRTCIHEAMEQQSISVAKAGMVCKLNTKCTILAATNPKGSYDTEKSISENTAIASPLLSRFDLVLTLLDTKNTEWDQILSSFILRGENPFQETKCNEGDINWNFMKMQAFFQHIKKLNPLLTPGANQVLSKYYQRQRRTDSAEAARTTVRLLQSCIRLAQGHARLMCRDSVEVEDAVCCVLLLEVSTVSSASLIKGVNTLHTAFPRDPGAEYRIQAKQILEGLQLPELWKEENARLASLYARSSTAEELTQLNTQSTGNRGERDSNLSLVMQAIQTNRLPSFVPPSERKAKRKRGGKRKVVEENLSQEEGKEKYQADCDTLSSCDDYEEEDRPRKRDSSATDDEEKEDSVIAMSPPPMAKPTRLKRRQNSKKFKTDSAILSPNSSPTAYREMPMLGHSQEDSQTPPSQTSPKPSGHTVVDEKSNSPPLLRLSLSSAEIKSSDVRGRGVDATSSEFPSSNISRALSEKTRFKLQAFAADPEAETETGRRTSAGMPFSAGSTESSYSRRRSTIFSSSDSFRSNSDTSADDITDVFNDTSLDTDPANLRNHFPVSAVATSITNGSAAFESACTSSNGDSSAFESKDIRPEGVHLHDNHAKKEVKEKKPPRFTTAKLNSLMNKIKKTTTTREVKSPSSSFDLDENLDIDFDI